MEELCRKGREISLPLVEWYRGCARDLPWRRRTDPYAVWVSEIMLQQTRVEAVKRYYSRFLETYPDVRSLAEGGEELLKLWEGLGYYSRARNLRRAARQVCGMGGFPRTFSGLKALAGIGDYTAAAVASICFGEPVAAVDGNVLRVLSRLCRLEEDVSAPAFKKKVFAALSEGMPRGREGLRTESRTPFGQPRNDAGDFNQGMMELGACVCLPNGLPKCGLCPLSALCEAHASGTETAYPVRAEKKSRRIEARTVFLLRRAGRVAILRRPAHGLLAGLWEFPSVPGNLGREEAAAAMAGLGFRISDPVPLGEARHVFTHLEWRMTGWAAEAEGEGLSAAVWATPEELTERYALPSALEFYRRQV